MEAFRVEDEDSLVVRALACLASVSVWFRSEQRGARVKDRTKNGVLFFALVSFLALSKRKMPFHCLSRSETKRKRRGAQAMRAREPASFWRENVVAVVILLGAVLRAFSENVVVMKTSYQVKC